MHPLRHYLLLLIVLPGAMLNTRAQEKVKLSGVGPGWAKNSVNVVVFRKNSLTSLGDIQYIAYYDNDATVVLGKRKLPSATWEIKKTKFKGNASDAHNSISIMVDGNGYLHMAWDHHGNPLRYSRSIAPGSLDMTEKIPMTGQTKTKVSYPEFYRTPNGNLIFFYRDGQSGNGNLVINQYDIQTQQWKQLQGNLIDGQGRRNAYWQACVDAKGRMHVSWVWRESPDVASNHDMCYAMSDDGGTTWKKSTGEKYFLPITAASAEYVARIPQASELINQTSMYALEDGTPFIASYWREPGDSVPQYHIIYRENNAWKQQNIGFRKMAFSLSGAGTKRIPISRPQVMARRNKKRIQVIIVFRDEELGNKVSVVTNNDSRKNNWHLTGLTTEAVGSWEPTYDTELWKRQGILHLFVQFADQQDSEGKTDTAPQQVKVLEWTPRR